MADETPVLRADATDDDLQEDEDFRTLSAEAALKLLGAEPTVRYYEPYENGEGGWSYRAVVG